ncbi:hypothetical protein M8756_14990 [Lutimaribacter sp. EGI FJ00015]|uniref:Uncharacterized protein n=2 Tax=Lutimaribacter degradans TaxID=2945989 RepID=A0ACC6A1F7_9RHOB|nr:hypothetical protein [Lutimaribacter sp. EGI FJ00013]MCM2563444.1 hypothetical protein [Lutimaribacter sp. EGI FJ00013]MCO0614624.1 hypothetical protein [Lutimaribacter sp. EGI FJ00015]MCO0637295.1 hypothetical protein [Lutimaribacter sp. EGI FJ00014]
MLPGTLGAGVANCAPRDRVVQRLAQDYGETRRSIGLGSGNRVIELYASDATGSWTITTTTPGGLTCLVATGEAFEAMTDALPVRGDDA